MYLLFKNHYGERISETEFGYIDLLSNNLSFNEYKITQEDVDSIEYWCDTIYSKEIFVPRRGLTSYCKKCPFDTPCSKWSGWNG
jgi:CRISPR/Cas system-associated exonuclease Cas4 (RecB family)